MFRKTLCLVCASLMAMGTVYAQDGFNDPDVESVEQLKSLNNNKKSKRQLMLEEQEVLENQRLKEEQERNARTSLENRRMRNRHIVSEEEKDAPEVKFAPSFTLGFGAGVGSVIGEKVSFIRTAVPAVQLYVSYFFSPVWGARIAGSYGISKSNYMDFTPKYPYEAQYSYRSLDLFAEGLVNLNNAIAGYKPGRPVEFYVYAGVGTLIGVDNCQACNWAGNRNINLPDHWTPSKAFFAGRAGVMMGVNVTPNIQLTVDGGVTISEDLVDSRIDRRAWVKAAGQVGLAYKFDPFLHRLAVIERKENNIPYYIGINVNAVDLGYLGTLNVGADINVSKHMVLGITAKFNPWVFGRNGDDPLYENKTMAYVGFKGYPWDIYDGWHFDGMAGWSKYRSKNKDGHPEEGNKFGAGVGFGYSYVINKFLNLEIGAGCWLGAKKFDTKESIKDNTILGSATKFFIEPYNVSLGITWVINPGATNKRIGNENKR